MTLRDLLTCPTCGGKKFVIYHYHSSEADGGGSTGHPCPDCVGGVPKTLVETAARAAWEAGLPNDPDEADVVRIVGFGLAALRVRETG